MNYNFDFSMWECPSESQGNKNFPMNSTTMNCEFPHKKPTVAELTTMFRDFLKKAGYVE